MTIESGPGTYALLCVCESTALIRIGRLGLLQLQPGCYVYAGSALGPGGIRARVAHHARGSPAPHWHIDYLRAHARLAAVWYALGRSRREHQWAAALRRLAGSVPMAGFGSSDCACESHLYFFPKPPALRRFRLVLTVEKSVLQDDQ